MPRGDDKNKGLTTVQAGRGLAALSVVLFHANAVLALQKYFGVEVDRLFGAGDSGVEFFFVLSGFIMVVAHHHQIGRVNKPWEFARKRFRRIYPPLWAALVIALGASAARGIPVSGWTVFKAFSAWPSADEQLLAAEWTLRHEMLFYALFGIFLWRPRLGLSLLAALFCAAIGLAFVQAPFPQGFILAPIHLLFLFGMLAAAAVLRLTVRAPRTLAGVGAATFTAAWLWGAFAEVDHDLPALVWTYGVGAALLLVGLVTLEAEHRLRAPAALVFLGEASYSIYLVHFPLVSALTKIAYRWSALLPLTWWFALVVCGAVAGGIMFHLLVEKPLIALGRTRIRRTGAQPAK